MAKASKPPSGDYEVGYQKPPAHTRYQKGQPSPNPKGRPKKPRHLAALIREEGEELISVPDKAGRKRRLPVNRVIIKQLKHDAMRGDQKARRDFLALQMGVTGGDARTPEEVLRQHQEEEERKALAAKTSEWIRELLEFFSQASSAGVLAFDPERRMASFSPLGGALAAYVEHTRRWPGREAEARAALLAALDQHQAERANSRSGGPPKEA